MRKEIKFSKNESILEYWKKLQIEPEFEEYAFLISEHPLLQSLSFLTNKCFFILDHARGRFAYMSEGINKLTGYTPLNYIEGNFDFSVSVIQPEYRNFMLNITHRIFFDWLNELPVSERRSARFGKEAIFKKMNGDLSRIFQSGTVLKLDKNDRVYLTLHTAEPINHLKKGPDVNFILSAKDMYKIYSYDVFTEILTDHNRLTKREIDILHCLESGLESKEIAARLQISPHTANTHRRNLLKKFSCVDTTALITYCKLCGIL